MVALWMLRWRQVCPSQQTGTRRGDVAGTQNKVMRALDCTVINFMQSAMGARRDPFDTVRGNFVEWDRVYPGAEIYRLTHVQLAVLNERCIVYPPGFSPELERSFQLPVASSLRAIAVRGCLRREHLQATDQVPRGVPLKLFCGHSCGS